MLDFGFDQRTREQEFFKKTEEQKDMFRFRRLPLPNNATDSCVHVIHDFLIWSHSEIATYLNISRRQLHRFRETIATNTPDEKKSAD